MGIFKERQSVKKKKAWKRRLVQLERVLMSVSIVIVGVGILYGLYNLVFFGDSFSVNKIVVEGKWKYLSAEELASLSGVKKNDNLFWISVSDIQGNLHQNPWVRKTAVRRRLPDALWIYAEEFKPLAIINDGGLKYVDNYGEVFKDLEASDKKSFPVLTGIDTNDDKFEDKLNTMVEILREFESSKLNNNMVVAEVNYNERKGYSLITDDNPVHIVLGYNKPAKQVGLLNEMYESIKQRAGRIIYILADKPNRVIVKYGES